LPGYSIINAGEIKYVSFNHFAETGLVNHAFTARFGGVGSGPYYSLNMGLHVGDDRETVLKNRRRACEALGTGLDHMVCGRQVHGDHVAVVTEADRGKGARDENDAFYETDALITSRPGVLLASYYADCVPVMILDPVKKAVGLAHAGWKGTVLRIAAKVVRSMQRSFGSRPEDCLAAIAPFIGPCCYEVDEPVKKAFVENGFDFAGCSGLSAPARWKLDLGMLNRDILIDAGIKTDNIAVADLCTSCRSDLFFSYRGQSGRCGRMASLIIIK